MSPEAKEWRERLDRMVAAMCADPGWDQAMWSDLAQSAAEGLDTIDALVGERFPGGVSEQDAKPHTLATVNANRARLGEPPAHPVEDDEFCDECGVVGWECVAESMEHNAPDCRGTFRPLDPEPRP